jgi:hypothetical protein
MESRPVRWRNAAKRASNAVNELHELREQLIAARDEIEESWTQQQASLKKVLLELIELQSEYASMTVPENLSDSKPQQKLYHVAELDFESMPILVR